MESPRSSTLLALTLLLACLAVPQVLAQAQLTPEQQRMLDRLPAAQRAEVMRQLQQFQATRPPADARDTEVVDDGERMRRPERETEEADKDPSVIQPGDTLVIEIVRMPRIDAEREDTGQPQHMLAGRHTVQLDRFGRLTMPGIDEVPLAGLDAEQAALRLMAEPMLDGMLAMVTRLTLIPVGRDALEPFGYNIFKRPVDWYDRQRPRPDMPVPADYLIGPGDTVQLQLFGKEFAQHTLTVTRDGTLQVPNIGPVAVSGMRYSEMKEALERRIREQTIGVQAAISMGELRSIEVFVIGDVERPGAHRVDSLATVVNALYAAEGISEIGTLRDIRLIRDGELLGRLDLYDLLLSGDPRGDRRLQPGDVVFVPSTGPRAGVMGEVLRPAWYELKDGATLGRLVDYAGGPGLEGDLARTQVQRISDQGTPEAVDVDGTSRAGRATPLQHGDLVVIPRVSRVTENTIALRGHFALTGLREWKDGLRLSDLMPTRSALKDAPDLDYGLVVRRLPDGRGITTLMFAPRTVIAHADSPDDIALRPRDEVLVFPHADFNARRALIDPVVERLQRQATRDAGARIARVDGAVRAPGTYPLSDGMRLYDLVRAGGGAAESAYLDNAEITHFEVIDGQQRRIEHREVRFADILARSDEANLAVQPHDILNVKTIPLWAERGTVELRGEVRFPGTYPIHPGELVSEVIERAGGLTEHAFPHASVFTRETLRRREQEQIDQMIRRLEADIATATTQQLDPESQQAQAMARSMVEQLRQTRAAGRLVIQLERLIDNAGDENYDVLARDGDLLVVPTRPQEVTVLGEVHFPTSHIYDPGLDRDDYLQRSGGVTYRADDKHMYVVRANGVVEVIGDTRRGRRTQINAGDTLVVPVDVDRVPPMVRLMNISQIVYQLGIAAAAWNTIGVF